MQYILMNLFNAFDIPRFQKRRACWAKWSTMRLPIAQYLPKGSWLVCSCWCDLTFSRRMFTEPRMFQMRYDRSKCSQAWKAHGDHAESASWALCMAVWLSTCMIPWPTASAIATIDYRGYLSMQDVVFTLAPCSTSNLQHKQFAVSECQGSWHWCDLATTHLSSWLLHKSRKMANAACLPCGLVGLQHDPSVNQWTSAWVMRGPNSSVWGWHLPRSDWAADSEQCSRLQNLDAKWSPEKRAPKSLHLSSW